MERKIESSFVSDIHALPIINHITHTHNIYTYNIYRYTLAEV